jgi:Domain of Unknown Function (DUF1543)
MPKLFMLLIGCKPKGRHTEQHDVFFGIGENVKELIPQVLDFWPEANGKLHFDGWQEVNNVDGYTVTIARKEEVEPQSEAQLFFINLGGYKPNEFEEFHYKMLAAATEKAEAINRSKRTAFYKHTTFEGATSHIDDKYGVDVDDMYAIEDILDAATKDKYRIVLKQHAGALPEDEMHLGYFKLSGFA